MINLSKLYPPNSSIRQFYNFSLRKAIKGYKRSVDAKVCRVTYFKKD